MKTSYILLTLLIFFSISTTRAQEKKHISIAKLVSQLNLEIAPTLKFSMVNDKALLVVSKEQMELDLNRKTPEKFLHRPGERTRRYLGPIFWLYDFGLVTQTGAAFEHDSLQQVRLRVTLNEPDSIVISSKLNNFSCYHPTYDSKLHQVLWTGEKALVLEFTYEEHEGKVNLRFKSIKLEGEFKRNDRFNLSKSYLSRLESRFQKSIEKTLQTENIKDMIVLNLNP